MKITMSHCENEMEICRGLRRKVFIEEQNVPEEEEWDGHDGDATHVLIWEAGEPIGTARLRILGDTGKLERFCVLKEHRGTGAGGKLLFAAVDYMKQLPNLTEIRLGAQTHALGFYAKAGFEAEGEEYDDAGIPHRTMVLKL